MHLCPSSKVNSQGPDRWRCKCNLDGPISKWFTQPYNWGGKPIRICRTMKAKNTHGTYFSCPSLEISSTSFSKRLSIAMPTAKPDAILKDVDMQKEQNGACQWYRMVSNRGLVHAGVKCKTGTWRAEMAIFEQLGVNSFPTGGEFSPFCWKGWFILSV